MTNNLGRVYPTVWKITEIYSHAFLQKFRQINFFQFVFICIVFTKNLLRMISYFFHNTACSVEFFIYKNSVKSSFFTFICIDFTKIFLLRVNFLLLPQYNEEFTEFSSHGFLQNFRQIIFPYAIVDFTKKIYFWEWIFAFSTLRI